MDAGTNELSKNWSILLKDYERLADDIRAIESANDKIVGVGVAIVSAGFAYGLKENVVEAFLFLPIALIGVFLYGAQQYFRLFWLGGYKRAVEDNINTLVGQRVICWEALVEEKRGRVNVLNMSLLSVYMGIFVGVISVSAFKVATAFGHWSGLMLVVVVLILMGLLIRGIIRLPLAYREAYKYAQDHLMLSLSPDNSVRK